MRVGHVIFLAATLMVVSAPAVATEAVCAPLAALTKALAEGRYHEAPIARASAESDVMLIVFASAGGETWTMVGVRAGRPEIGCMLGAGTDWQAGKPPPAGKPS